MKLLDFFFARAAQPTTDYRHLAGPRSDEVVIEIDEWDDDDLIDEEQDREWVGGGDDIIIQMPANESGAPTKRAQGEPLENLFCYIEYQNSKLELTRRPITMLSLKQGPNGPLIYALCHMRKANRSFRCDRIINVISVDGEIFPGADYLRDTLQITTVADVATLAAPAAAPRLRSAIMAPLTVLVAAAKSDGCYHIEEIDRIVSFAEREAFQLHGAGLVSDEMTIEMSDALTKVITGMRPQAKTLERHIMAVLSMPEDQRKRFKRALEAVIIADGHIRAEEEEFWTDFDRLAVSAGLDPLATWDEIREAAQRVA